MLDINFRVSNGECISYDIPQIFWQHNRRTVANSLHFNLQVTPLFPLQWAGEHRKNNRGYSSSQISSISQPWCFAPPKTSLSPSLFLSHGSTLNPCYRWLCQTHSVRFSQTAASLWSSPGSTLPSWWPTTVLSSLCLGSTGWIVYKALVKSDDFIFTVLPGFSRWEKTWCIMKMKTGQVSPVSSSNVMSLELKLLRIFRRAILGPDTTQGVFHLFGPIVSLRLMLKTHSITPHK